MTPVLLLLASLTLQDAPAAATPPAAAEPAAASAAPALTSAPTDDYGFVSWCRGALTGHMELYRSVSPEIARVRDLKAQTVLAGKSGAEADKLRAALAKDAAREAELDVEQLKAGEDYLALYKSAIDAAEAAGSPRGHGEEAGAQGYRIWSAARAADGKTQMYSYLMWELPGRCETAAKALKEQSSLFGAAFKRADAAPPPAAEPVPAPPADVPPADATTTPTPASEPAAPPAPDPRPSTPPGA